jgi:2-oxoisovalerate dehydrogenase E1 component
VIIEPIALYHTRDLREEGDGLWLASDDGRPARFGEPRVYHPDAKDMVVATYGNGTRIALSAASVLKERYRIECRVLDLRWIAPLPKSAILSHATEVGRLLVLDECRRSGNVSEAVGTAIAESRVPIRFARVTAEDCLVPLGPATSLVLPEESDVIDTVRRLVAR